MSPRPGTVPAFVDVVVERWPPGSVTDHGRHALSGDATCLRMHRVEFKEYRFDTTCGRMIYRFRARDAESVRLALRCGGIDYESLKIVLEAGI